MACAGRHHRWPRNPPTDGDKCIGCGRIYAGDAVAHAKRRRAEILSPGAGAVVAPVAPLETPEASPSPAPSPGRKISIAEMFRIETPAAPAAAPAATAAPPPPPMPSGWTKVAGPRLARVILLGTARLAAYTSKEKKKYEAGEVDDDTEELCEASVTNALAHWFPDAQLSPAKQMIVAFTFAFGEQWIGRTEITDDVEDVEEAEPPSRPEPRSVARAAATPSPPPERPPTPTETDPAIAVLHPDQAFDGA